MFAINHLTNGQLDLILTFFDIALLLDKVVDNLLLSESLLLFVGLLALLRLRRFCLLKHAHVVSEAIEIASEWLALAFDVGLCILKRRSKQDR